MTSIPFNPDNFDENFGKEDSSNSLNSSYDPTRLMSLEEIKKTDETYLLQNYAKAPIAFHYGSGEFLYDENGKEYVDFLSGIAVTSVGHAHPDLVETLQRQGDLLWHSSNLFYNQQQAMLARALVEINFPAKVMFCNSGTEANEAALKLIRAWGELMTPKKSRILALKNSFHGRTMGAMSVTGQEKVQSGFGLLLQDIDFVEPNDIASLRYAFNEEVAGMIIEPVQGEGGVLSLDQKFLEEARNLSTKNEAILVFDEVQIGMGRSGHYFAWQNAKVQPDALTIAKGLGGGFPIGAILIAERYTDILKSGMHGSTFGGNHLACAIAYEVIRIIESQKLLKNTQEMGKYLKNELERLCKKYPATTKEVRGLGLLLGLVLREDIQARPIVTEALKNGLVIGRAGENILRFAPPLNVREKTIDRAIRSLDQLLSELSPS